MTEALRLHASTGRRRPEQAFVAAAEALHDLAEKGARYFPLPSSEAKRMESWAGADGFYAAHEYLGSNCGPLMFDQVARTMADARCSFVGTTPALSAFQFNWMPDELREMFQSIDDVVLREIRHDVFGERALRSDLYRQGLVPVTSGKYAKSTETLETAGLRLELDDKPTELLDVAAILEIHHEWTPRHAVIAMALLSGGGLATPSVQGEPSAEVRERCRRVNKVVFAEGGLNVLFVNCDSRRARIHRYLIADTPHPPVDDVLVPRETTIPGVHLVTGIGEGSAETNPIEVVALQQQIIDAYRGSYHVILLDTAPFLATNDASELLSRTDLVTVVVRSGRTTAESAHRVAEVLERFAAPVLGVVFNGSDETRGAQYYYYGYTEPSQPPPVQPQAQPAAAATAAAAQN